MERKPHRKAYRREYARARYAADPEYRERKLEIYRRSYRKRRAAAQA